MFKFLTNFFKKSTVDKDEFDEALETARNRRMQRNCTKYCRNTQLEKPYETKSVTKERTLHLLDSGVACNDIECEKLIGEDDD